MRYLTATAAALLLTAAGISQDTFFSISPSFTTDTEVPAVTVLTPNGGEEFAAGSIITVEWEAVGLSESFTDAIFISVRFAPGEDGIMLGEYLPNSGSVDVTLPEIGSYTAELAVAAADNFLNVGYDITDAVFTILLSGCTDPTACNYNPLANAENGSCIYPEPEICNDGLDNDCNGFTDLDDLACSESVYLSVPDTYPTIQSAIDAAIDGMIVLVAPGTYTENINFSSKNITVASHFILEDDPGMIEATVIDGNAAGRTVTIVNGENDAVLIGFSIVHGIAAGESTVGGGILLYGSSPRIEYCNIHDNSAGNYGGGLSISGGANPILS
ncbi:MAG: hypothetical protein H8D46_04870, partial [FCB group bacterium]|nr:hypothetical protein [FCB group bacterium]